MTKMINEFKNLTEQESNLMLMAPALVTLLIAGAEGKLEQKELDWGEKITHFRANENSILQNYYHEVEKNFNQTLKKLIEIMPVNTETRNHKINNELYKLNDTLSKLAPEFAKQFYKSLLSLARHIAKSSGGIWGYGAISPEEQKLLDLQVLVPPTE